MKIIATSDLHGFFPEIEPCDVLIIAGDITPIGFDREIDRVDNWTETVLQEWLQFVPATHILAIPGNHDFYFERHLNDARLLPWTWISDDEVTIDGVKFYGTPWVPNLRGWAWYGDDRILNTAYQAIPDDTDIVISHGPPLGLLDGGTNYGTKFVNEMLDRIQPPIFICGHVHEGYGIEFHPDHPGIIANVAHCDIYYNPVNKPMEFTWGPDQ